ncbi:MAG: four helix bundle protein [Lentisphaerae bacterium]|jgi:four helix bundle protein|nr:four helix bundle protein [Lentisphaerota bacterium]
MKYLEWEENVPEVIRADALWKMKVYRLSLFLSDICWEDVSKLVKDARTKSLSDQLYRSVGSICANIEEGYSKQGAKDRARFYEYALGSARESRGWFYRGLHVLGSAVFDHRSWILTEIIKLLLTIVPAERGSLLHEDSPEYLVAATFDQEVPF